MAIRVAAVAAAIVLAGCLNHQTPRDRTLEHITPLESSAAPLPAALKIVTFNLHIEPGAKIIRGLRSDPALRDGEPILEMDRVDRDRRGVARELDRRGHRDAAAAVDHDVVLGQLEHARREDRRARDDRDPIRTVAVDVTRRVRLVEAELARDHARRAAPARRASRAGS